MSQLRTHESARFAANHPITEVQRAQAQIHASPYCSLRKVVCECRGDQLVLRGHVESYHLKQLAQEAVRRQSRGQTIVNLLTVD